MKQEVTEKNVKGQDSLRRQKREMFASSVVWLKQPAISDFSLLLREAKHHLTRFYG